VDMLSQNMKTKTKDVGKKYCFSPSLNNIHSSPFLSFDIIIISYNSLSYTK
jgi:hypothetical protein